MQLKLATVLAMAALANNVSAASTATNSGKCYALAFSSGDQSSAYQAGVLSGLAENLSADQVAYSAVSGVSGGAINSVLLSSFGAGQEVEAAARMSEFWAASTNDKLY